MKRTPILLTLLIVIICLAFWLTDLKYAFKAFTISAAGNEPNLKMGSIVFGTNLKKPKKFDFVLYEQELDGFPKGIWAQRLVGIESDTLELKKGVLFVNGINVDANLVLNHDYLTDGDTTRELVKDGVLSENKIRIINKDSIVILLSSQIAQNHAGKVKRFFAKEKDNEILENYGQPWSQDDFGPIVVPEESVFMLGDNRNHSYDSRFFGFVKREKIKGVILK